MYMPGLCISQGSLFTCECVCVKCAYLDVSRCMCGSVTL